jgi:GntR family transcriptional repressor for pyruvate dehydrogenase complex
MFNPILKPESLSRHVEAELTRAIRQGKYRPSEKIPTENELCSIFNVSRTVIREAIRGLNARGIVQVKKGSGVYVSEMSIKNASETLNLFFGLSSDKDLMLNAIESRALIEPAIAAQSALVRSESHIRLLQKNIEGLDQCPLEDKVGEAELDSQFHGILLKSIDNPVLHLLMDPVFNLISTFKHDVFAKTITDNMAKEKEIMLQYHRGITSAIIKMDPVKAEMLMKEHLRVTLENYKKSTKE